SASERSKTIPKVTKRAYRKKIKQEQPRSPSESPVVDTPPPYLQLHSQYRSHYGSPPLVSEKTCSTEQEPLPRPIVYGNTFLSSQSKCVSPPELLYEQPTSFSKNFYPYSFNDNQFSQQSWPSATSEPTSQQKYMNLVMQTAIDPALACAMDPTLNYLPSVYDDFSVFPQKSEIETDDELESHYLAATDYNYPWESFVSYT